MNARIERLFGWSGIASIVVIGIGFCAVAGFLPPPSPDHNAAWVADYFRDNANAIRWGMIIMMVGAGLLALYVVAMTLQMRRIEGVHSGLAYLTLAMGAVLVLQFIYLDFFWQAASFRVDRGAETIQALNDMAWIPFIAATAPIFIMCVAFAAAILGDTRQRPAFPRWLAYVNLWAALGMAPGTFTVFFKTGPLAWNGVLSFWVPVGVFGVWMVVNSIYLVKAVAIAEESSAAAPVGGEDGAGAEVEEEIGALRAEIDRLSARVGRAVA